MVNPARPKPGQSLGDLYPDLARQWATEKNGDITPFDVAPRSNFKAWWYCGDPKCPTPGGTLFETKVTDRKFGISGCPLCRNRKIGEKKAQPKPGMTLEDKVPAALELWDMDRNLPLTPRDVGFGSTTSVWWKCNRGPDHAWQAPIDRVVHSVRSVKDRSKNNGCPFCAGKRLSVTNRLSDVHPELSKSWHPERNGDKTPADVVTGSSSISYWWTCEKDTEHVWQTNISARIKSGCPFCVDKSHRATSKNNFALLRPEAALQWHPTKNDRLPTEVTPGSGYEAWWQCSEYPKHVWQARVAHRFTVNSACPFCSGKNVSDENNLLAMRPHLAAQWHPTKNGKLTPETINAFSNNKAWWKCPAEDDHEWHAIVASRSYGDHGCPFCSGLLPSSKNNLQVAYPFIAAEWHPTKNGVLTPTDVTPNANKKAWWVCPENDTHVWRATISKRRISGCPTCAKFGFASPKPGYLYLLTHPEWELLQIGITNVPEQRLHKHEGSGWTTLDVRGPMDGQLTRDLETGILKALKKRGAVFAKATGLNKFDGWSEAWTEKSYHAVKLSQLIDLVYEDD